MKSYLFPCSWCTLNNLLEFGHVGRLFGVREDCGFLPPDHQIYRHSLGHVGGGKIVRGNRFLFVFYPLKVKFSPFHPARPVKSENDTVTTITHRHPCSPPAPLTEIGLTSFSFQICSNTFSYCIVLNFWNVMYFLLVLYYHNFNRLINIWWKPQPHFFYPR